MERTRLAGFLLAAVLVASPFHCVTAQSFDDPAVARWTEPFWTGRPDEVLRRLSEELAKPEPHPFAMRAWVQMHLMRETLDDITGDLAEVARLQRAGRHAEVVERYSEAALAGGVDPFLLSDIQRSAETAGQIELSVRVLLRGIIDHPSHFQFVWELTGHRMANPAHRALVQAAINDGRIPPDSLAAGYLVRMLAVPELDAISRVEIGRAWLQRAPGDVRAMAMVAFALNSLHRYEDAAELAERAFRLYPFFANSDIYWLAMARSGRLEEAQVTLGHFIRGFYGAEHDKEKALRLGAEQRREGDLGAARRTVTDALARNPGDSWLQVELARIEHADERFDQSLELMEQTINQGSDRIVWWQVMLDAARGAQRASQVLSIFERMKPAGVEPDLAVYGAVSWAYGALERTGDRRTLMAQAVERFPESQWMRREFALALHTNNERDQAVRLLIETIDADPSNAWAWIRLREWAPDRLRAVAERHASWSYGWRELAALETTPAARLAIWRRAIAANPRAALGWVGGVGVLSEAAAIRMASEARAALEQAESTELLAVDKLFAEAVAAASQHMTIPEAQLDEAVAAAERLRDAGGSLVDYHNVARRVALARDDTDAAAEHAIAAAMLTRDYARFHDLVADHGRVLGYRAWAFGADTLARQPMHQTVIHNLLHKHVMWGGSPVVALSIIEAARARGADIASGSLTMEAQAYGQLGDGVRDVTRFLRSTAIANGDRYIQQYEQARQQAQRSDQRRVHLVADTEHPTVDIVSPDGTVFRRTDDRVSGKVRELSQGSSWTRVDYDAQGQLTRVANAAGSWSEFDYTGTQITAMRTSEGASLAIAYGDQSKPVRIEIAGVGTLLVEYDDDGNTTQVSVEPVGDRSDSQVSLEVTRAFQGMQVLVRNVQESTRSGRLPDMPTPDPVYDRLEEAFRNADGESDAEVRASMALARHMAANLNVRSTFASSAMWYFAMQISQGREEGASRVAREQVVPAIIGWQDVLLATRPYGVSADDLALWNEYQRWLTDAATAGDRAARTALTRGVQTPESVDPPWHVRHALGNPGYWRRYANADILPERVRTAEKRAVLVRGNGDIVVGTASGFSVLRDGHWRYFVFDPRQGTFIQPVASHAGDARSSVTALAETRAGTLWIGTEDGLYALGADYGEGVQEWRSSGHGLPAPRITALAAHDDELWIGTSAGLRRWNGSAITTSDGPLDGQGITGLDVVDGTVTVRTAQGATVRYADRWQVLSRQPVDGAVYDRREQVFLLLRENRVFAVPARTLANPVETHIPGEVRVERAVHGLVRITVDGVEQVPAVLTDTGIAFFRDWRMSMMELPLREQRNGLVTGPRVAGSGAGGSWFVTHEAVYGFETGRVIVEQRGERIHDVLSDAEYGLTWVAAGNMLGFVPHDAVEGGMQMHARIRSTHLALAKDGSLITNDGNQIVRIVRGQTQPQDLFLAHTPMPESWMHGPVRHIEVTRDGTIWVAAGPSVYRYTTDKTLTHFNWFEDPNLFPARSQMISRVVETVTGEIWVVASSESHLNWRGVSLIGGLMRFNGEAFERVGDEGTGASWFITGYTALDERTAVVGTTRGFVRHRDGQYAQFQSLGVPSYDRLRAALPNLWLGGRGAKLDEGRWLFPSAAGIVMLNHDQWLLPTRLNQLLPEDARFGQYGGRTVHAVATDPRGNIYAGTDLGLMIYRGGGGGASLLIDNQMPDVAFNDHDTWQLREQREVLLDSVKGDSTTAQVVARIRDQDRELDRMERRANGAESPTPMAVTPGEQPLSRTEATRLREQMQERQRERARLLARLERENFGLFQMLTLDPRELAALHRELTPNQAVVQYIPDARSLHIQIVTRDGTQMVEVTADRERIEQAARRVSHHLTASARALPDYELRAGTRGGLRLAGIQLSPQEQYEADITWLYDTLIRPARIALGDRTQVFVVPVGSLYYLPFGVLKDRATGELAVQRYTLGVLPSMYHLSLVLRHQPSLSETSLIVGDPDGTLPGARREADLVRTLAGARGETLIGNQATIAAFSTHAPESRIVHIATHGVLDHERPEASYLVMGNGQRLDVVDIQMLPLAETDLVVLSACDTGLGRSGLEVATLARAFAHARVPTVVASLWQVNDGATLALMSGFYERLKAGDDHLAALANAQRALLARDDEYARPEAWAGFQVFGKP